MTATAPHPSLASIKDPGALIARHLQSVFRTALHGPGTTVAPRFARLVTGEPHPFGNFTIFAHPVNADDVPAAVEPLLGCNAPSAAIFTGPVPPAAARFLETSGYGLHDPMPAMGVEIDRLAATTLPAGYQFARIGSADGDRWMQAFCAGYALPVAAGAAMAPKPGADMGERSRLQYFAVLKDGGLVCTSAMFLDDGVAGIYCVATLPGERGKGLGAHATAQPLRLARALGYRVGILQSSEAGYPVYKRLGFADFGGLPLFVRMPS